MQRFLADFPGGLREGRYRAHTLPHLDFHAASIEHMCRVAVEARVFPLLHGYGGRSPHLQSPHLQPVIGALSKRAYRVEIRGVSHEFQCGRDEMLAVAR